MSLVKRATAEIGSCIKGLRQKSKIGLFQQKKELLPELMMIPSLLWYSPCKMFIPFNRMWTCWAKLHGNGQHVHIQVTMNHWWCCWQQSPLLLRAKMIVVDSKDDCCWQQSRWWQWQTIQRWPTSGNPAQRPRSVPSRNWSAGQSTSELIVNLIVDWKNIHR